MRRLENRDEGRERTCVSGKENLKLESNGKMSRQRESRDDTQETGWVRKEGPFLSLKDGKYVKRRICRPF